jgi:hypothetical protein
MLKKFYSDRESNSIMIYFNNKRNIRMQIINKTYLYFENYPEITFYIFVIRFENKF